MKKNYQNPVVNVINYSLEEILTDVISASGTGTSFSNASWNDFVSGNIF